MLTWLCCHQPLKLPIEVVGLPCLALDLIHAPFELYLALGNGSILHSKRATALSSNGQRVLACDKHMQAAAIHSTVQ